MNTERQRVLVGWSKRGRRTRVLAAALCVALLAIAGCGGGTASGGSAKSNVSNVPTFGLDKSTIKAAMKEGHVLHLGSIPDKTAEVLTETFNDYYGIEVEIQYLGGGETNERVRTQYRAGNVAVDTIGNGGFFPNQLAKEGLLKKFLPPGAQNWLLTEADPKGYWFPITAQIYGIGVNTDRVEKVDIPHSWRELLEYEGPMLTFDPTVGSAGFKFYIDVLQDPALGEEYLRKLGALENLTCGGDTQRNVLALARGEYDIYFPFSTRDIETVEGAPVEYINPNGKVLIAKINAAVIKAAPHPNAAKLWLTFLLSKEGQRIFAEHNQVPVREGIAKVPQFDLAELDPINPSSVERQEKLIGPVLDGAAQELGLC